MEKINVAKLLKDCPKGMELDCTMYDNVKLIDVDEREEIVFPIRVVREDGITELFTEYGQYIDSDFAKCVIYPKGKTTWEGFKRPFKDGDIVFYNDTIAIFKEWGDETLFKTYVTKYLCCDSLIDINVPLFGKSVRKEIRFATEEEKDILFEAIKDKGYRWNTKTKTLEKLIVPKFKVGDKIIRRNSVRFPERNSWIVVSINSKFYEIKLSEGIGSIGVIPISEQDDWELLPVVPKFKVGDKVRYKDDTTVITITGKKDDYYFIQFYNPRKNDYQTERFSFKDQDKYELVPNKFDLSTLKPFEEVLVRYGNLSEWSTGIFSHTVKSDNKLYFIVNTQHWEQCIPYKGNEHLRGTTDACSDYFKTWEE